MRQKMGMALMFAVLTVFTSGCPVLFLPCLLGTEVGTTAGAISSTTGGGVEVGNFENSVLPDKETAAKLRALKSVAIMNNGSSSGMGRRFTLWLKQQNRVQVVTPSEFSKRINLYGLGEMTEEEKIGALLSAGKELNVDVVIILDSNTPKADIAGYGALVGKKSKLHHKFLVSLLSVVDQKVVWQDELPYSVTISTTHVASEEEIDKAVAEKFIGRFKAVVLGEKEQASELFLKFGDLAA